MSQAAVSRPERDTPRSGSVLLSALGSRSADKTVFTWVVINRLGINLLGNNWLILAVSAALLAFHFY